MFATSWSAELSKGFFQDGQLWKVFFSALMAVSFVFINYA
jgi:hypothetical protein